MISSVHALFILFLPLLVVGALLVAFVIRLLLLPFHLLRLRRLKQVAILAAIGLLIAEWLKRRDRRQF